MLAQHDHLATSKVASRFRACTEDIDCDRLTSQLRVYEANRSLAQYAKQHGALAADVYVKELDETIGQMRRCLKQ